MEYLLIIEFCLTSTLFTKDSNQVKTALLSNSILTLRYTLVTAVTTTTRPRGGAAVTFTVGRAVAVRRGARGTVR